MTEELTQILTAMSEEEREELLLFLLRDVQVRHEKNKERPRQLIQAVSKVIGEDVSLKSRDFFQVWARAFVIYELSLEGWHNSEIGRVMAKDHSTIYHTIQKMNDVLAYPNQYRDIIRKYEQFKNSIS